MLFVLGFTAVFFLLATLLAGREKPSPLNPDLWDADPEVARTNYEAALAAWRTGEDWVSPRRLARLMDAPVTPAAVIAAEDARGGRWVRCCAIHKPRWVED